MSLNFPGPLRGDAVAVAQYLTQESPQNCDRLKRGAVFQGLLEVGIPLGKLLIHKINELVNPTTTTTTTTTISPLQPQPYFGAPQHIFVYGKLIFFQFQFDSRLLSFQPTEPRESLRRHSTTGLLSTAWLSSILQPPINPRSCTSHLTPTSRRACLRRGRHCSGG